MSSELQPKPFVTPAGPIATWVAGRLVRGLSRLSRAGRQKLARYLGWLVYSLGIRRRVTLDNLRRAFPERSEAENRRIARGAYANMALVALEALTSSGMSEGEIQSAVRLENWEPLDEALKAGRGVLVATAHFGSWELVGEVLARRGVPISAVVRPLKGALNAHIVESRQKAGMHLILQRGAIGGIIKALREGRLVAQLVDQVLPAKNGVFVPFFGRPASTTPALSIAALRTGAPVFAIVAVREGEHLRMVVEGPVPVPRTGDTKQDIRLHTAAVTEILEKHIRRWPEQWLWLHRRWKVQPADGPLEAAPEEGLAR